MRKGLLGLWTDGRRKSEMINAPHETVVKYREINQSPLSPIVSPMH